MHIGKLIEEVVRNKRIGVSELATKINKSRPVVYDIFQRETIDTGLLERLSKVLDYNFFQCFVQPTGVQEDPEVYSKQQKRIKELEIKLSQKEDELANAHKEIEYLKKINKLLEEKK